MQNNCMRPLFFSIIAGCSLFFALAPAKKPLSKPVPVPTVSHPTEKKLVWSDEFSVDGLPDSTKWAYEKGGGGWGNNEAEYYTVQRPENARVENGCLIIEARKEKWKNREYTSARLVTRGKASWKYGHIEVRAKLPHGKGTWPAIWTLGDISPFTWPDDGEIDIMEHVGYDPGMIHGSIHCKTYNHVMRTQKTAITQVADCMDTFHVYSLDWNADSIAISIDNKQYFSFHNEHSNYAAWPFDNPQFLILNVAIGGNWGGKEGIDDTALPQKMIVDYVRAYQ